MKEDGRFIPPGLGRIAAFARRGGFGTSPLLSAGAGMLSAALVLYFCKAAFHDGLTGLFREGLNQAAAGGTVLSAVSERIALPLVRLTLPVLLAAGTGTAVGAFLPAWAARRHKGDTAVPLPKMPRAGFGVLVIRVFGAALFLLTIILIARDTASSLGAHATPVAALGVLLFRILVALGAVSLLTGAAERMLLSHFIYHALFLDRSEHRREMRAEQGSRDASLRRARAQHREVNS